MKRGVFDVLRRGFDNTVANWGLIVVRLVETLVFLAIAAAAIVAVLLPILVAAGVELAELDTPDDVESAIGVLLGRWALLVWAFVAVCIVTLIFIALHAFVEAGCARVYVDGERVAGPANDAGRARFRLFSVQRWLDGAKEGWWSVFWIYNLAWGVGGLIMLIPLLPTLILTLLFRDSPGAAVAMGCLGLMVSLLVMIVVSVVVGIWSNRAIAEWGVQGGTATASLAQAWQAFKADLGRHLLITLAMIVIAIAGSSFFASFSWVAAVGEMMHERAVMNFITLPLRLFGTVASTVFSTTVTSWYLASYVALAVEGRAGGS